MNKIQGTIIGILMFIFGIVGTYYTWSMLTGFYGMIDSILLKVIWVVGLFTVWSANVLIVPYLFITGGSGITVKNSIKGLVIFLIASFCTLLSYYIIPPIITVLNGITTSSIGTSEESIYAGLGIVGNLIWFGLILFWVISLIVYPLAVILRGGIKKQKEE